jgi:Sporulation and spore germination
MPRRFALALLLVLVLVLAALIGARAFRMRAAERRGMAVPTARPTPPVPPTPIPARRVALYFESTADDKLHAEARDVPESTDALALLKTIGAAVLDGPRRTELVKPFPDGWKLRGAYRLATGLVVVDLAPPPALPAAEGAAAGPRWNAGSHEEETAIQALLASLTKNLPDVQGVVFLVAGEPAETLGGHIDLSHPLHADLSRLSDEAPGEPPPPAPPATATPAATPAAAASPAAGATPSVTPHPGAAPSPSAAPRAPRPSRPAPESA